MRIERLTRRDFSLGVASLFPLFTAASAKTGWDPGISNKAETIHQVVPFQAPRARIYDVLLDTEQFSKMTGGLGTQISRDVGGAFSLFSSQIKGRQVDLVPGELILQAWRSEGWKPHLYSIVRFALIEQGSGTQLIFDHTGFPVGQAEHLAKGWRDHYWVPLEKFLA
jgi:activator of HSP90 ATPase